MARDAFTKVLVELGIIDDIPLLDAIPLSQTSNLSQICVTAIGDGAHYATLYGIIGNQPGAQYLSLALSVAQVLTRYLSTCIYGLTDGQTEQLCKHILAITGSRSDCSISHTELVAIYRKVMSDDNHVNSGSSKEY